MSRIGGCGRESGGGGRFSEREVVVGDVVAGGIGQVGEGDGIVARGAAAHQLGAIGGIRREIQRRTGVAQRAASQ